jgi:hypothetical protein
MAVVGLLFLPAALHRGVTGWLVVQWLLATPMMVVLVGVHEAAHAYPSAMR